MVIKMSTTNDTDSFLYDSEMISILDPLDEEGNSFSYPDHSSELSHPSRKKSGRNKIQFTYILENFKTKKIFSPKKEYFNAWYIRGIKKSFRWLLGSKIPTTTWIKVNVSDRRELGLWKELQELYIAEGNKIREIARTDTGPATDGRNRRETSENIRHKSFNNEFCAEFFSERVNQVAFYVLLELVFSSTDPNVLCSKFGFFCCMDHSSHSGLCLEKWQELHQYLSEHYIEDFGITDIRKNNDLMQEGECLEL